VVAATVEGHCDAARTRVGDDAETAPPVGDHDEAAIGRRHHEDRQLACELGPELPVDWVVWEVLANRSYHSTFLAYLEG